ncbi:hypothetical protein ACGFMK_20380 [Amycolatopsis sp. NPDC049252]|uniref:hypothetical protein n=1 Tax=Amycolatopsis sp. NPDC049252 TaxID=3363933 RepID=UPI00371A8A52
MTRGKRARARQGRAERALREEIAWLREEIDLETRRAAQARAAAEQVAEAREQLAQERRLTARRLAPYAAEARRRAEGAIRTREQLKAVARKVRAVDEELTGAVGDSDSISEIQQAGVPVSFPGLHSSASDRYRQVWLNKRIGTPMPQRQLSLRGWIPDDVEENPDEFAGYAYTYPVDVTPQACWAWAIPPWMRIPTDESDAPELRTQFGAIGAGAPQRTIPDFPIGVPALRRDMLMMAPWRHLPLISHPGDALDLGYWYRRSTWAQDWHRDAEPVPMWLPAEHSSSFPAARALPDEVDLRLPFPAVFAVLSTPWRIDPHPDAGTHPLLSQHPLFMHARGRLGDDLMPPTLEEVLGRLQATGLTDRGDLPSPLEFLDRYGGYVEGVLLTADEHGVPGDDIAWCVVIYHPMGMPLGRITIPASRRHATWRQQVDNLIAGIALSCWHETTTLPARLTGKPRIGAATTDPGALHVIDIDATSPHRAHPDGEENGAAVRPHLRRGHWRHQRIGHERRERRWTWVRATAVHGGSAGRGQVYILRA